MMPEKIYSIASVDRFPGVIGVTTGDSQKDVEVCLGYCGVGEVAGVARIVEVARVARGNQKDTDVK